MKTFATLKAEARQSLRGKWPQFALMTFVYGLLSGLCSAPSMASDLFGTWGLPTASGALSVAGWVLAIAFLVVEWGYEVMFLRNLRDPRFDDAGAMFDGFRRNFVNVLSTMLLQTIYTLLWSLLLVVPGIIKAYAYAMTPYVLADHPDWSANQAISRSQALMRGHKMELFVLHLSFLGWALLCIATLGVACLWVGPYVLATQAAFYEDLRSDYSEQLRREAESEPV